MVGGAAIGLHNAFEDSVDTDPFIDAACSSAADAAGSSRGNATAGTDVQLLITLKLRWMNLKAWV